MNKQKTKIWLALTPVLLALFMLSGCAAKTAPIWGDPQTGLILQYQMPEGQVLKYESWEKTHQVSDLMGRTIETDISSKNAFSVKSNSTEETNHKLTITVHEMSIKVQSPQTDLEPDMSSVIGKSFDMMLSSLGEESNLTGAEDIKYEMGPEGERSIASTFQHIFPDLAGRPLQIGDTWPDETTISEKTSSGEVVIRISEINTLGGFESIDEMECVRILSQYTGTLEGKGAQQGIELNTKGDIKGTATWYFAYKKGIFVKHINKGTAQGMVDVPSQGLEIPFTREMTSEIKLKKSN
ncbi:MAG: hypothetical protein GF421_10855 [Candidatus Aminicenantes bacterium]|nr:hypothetical protein [Candidatus Aminicenantes bacterium]